MMPHPPALGHSDPATWALIPAHNEARSIGEVVRRALPHLGAVFVVADGCTDRTAETAAEAGAAVIALPERRGKATALRHGWAALAAEPAWRQLVLLDGDGQHDPASIPALIAARAATGAELVLGRRDFEGTPMPLARRWTNRLMSRVLSHRVGQGVADSQCGFRLATREFLESRHWRSNHFEIESEMILHAAARGWRVAEVPIATVYRQEQSKISPCRDAWRWLRLLQREATPDENSIAF